MNIQSQFKEMVIERNLFPIFEIEVLNKISKEKEYILFHISCDDSAYLKATHVGLTKEQLNSDKIAFVKVDIDEDFTLDSHLIELYEECINAILGSEFYEIAN